jgi:hypothetical protein
METAMEELIEYIEEWTAKNKTTDGIWSKAKSLLSKEKQQIVDAYNIGFIYPIKFDFKNNKSQDAEQYYNETFNNETTNND